jgi:hypothetical protein
VQEGGCSLYGERLSKFDGVHPRVLPSKVLLIRVFRRNATEMKGRGSQVRSEPTRSLICGVRTRWRTGCSASYSKSPERIAESTMRAVFGRTVGLVVRADIIVGDEFRLWRVGCDCVDRDSSLRRLHDSSLNAWLRRFLYTLLLESSHAGFDAVTVGRCPDST